MPKTTKEIIIENLTLINKDIYDIDGEDELWFSQSEVDDLNSQHKIQLDTATKLLSLVHQKEVSKLKQDISDMYNAHNTIFQRCSCGRLRERGLICPNEQCPERCE